MSQSETIIVPVADGESSGREDGPVIPITSLGRSGPARHSSATQSLKKFINALNYIHFSEDRLFLHMSYKDSNDEFLVRVFPEPCQGPEVRCRFPEGFPDNPEDLKFRNLIINDGKSILCMPIEVTDLLPDGFSARMESACRVFSDRQVTRFLSLTVVAIIGQKGVRLEGRLEDFNPYGFRISLGKGSLEGLDAAEKVSCKLSKEGTTVFSGACRIIRIDNETRSIVVSPKESQWSVYKKRKLRSPRVNLVPTPKMSFSHPLTGKKSTYEIHDITTLGFSVHEDSSHFLLFPGLIVHDVTIMFAGGFRLTCDAQVVYSLNRNHSVRRYGIAITDMDMKSYNDLFDILSNADDKHANLTRDMEMDALWKFFFDSGFLYPKKYLSLSENKEDFKKTYDNLYHNCPRIFGSIIYQRNGSIYGHISLIRAYTNTWMFHHLAALPLGKKRTGLAVLHHITNYYDGLYRLPSVNMDYLICYYRPDNRFPDYFFGGPCREIDNPKGCSADELVYLTHEVSLSSSLPEGWSLVVSSADDIGHLSDWYDKVSGGLMIESFCLAGGANGGEGIRRMYAEAGLHRQYCLWTLACNGKSKAYLLNDRSDVGINLSDLLNCIKVFVVDGTGLTWDILKRAVDLLGRNNGTSRIPVLVYPVSYALGAKVDYEKKYVHWVLNSRYGGEYCESIKRKATFNPAKFIVGYIKSKLKNN